MTKADILIVGATGFTGRLILKYLASKAQRDFSLSVAGRSITKLQALVTELGLKPDEDIKILQLDVLNEEQVKDVIQGFKVVISAVGPFWKFGRILVAACAELGVHYVDTTGETHFIKWCVEQLDFLATKTGAILVPAAGFDSVPSDMTAFLGVRNLQQLVGADAKAGKSTSAFKVKGFGLSGGTLATLLDIMGGTVPKDVLARTLDPFCLSPVRGPSPQRPKLIYRLPFTKSIGGFFFMSPVNTAFVRRTWGLYSSAATQRLAAASPDAPPTPIEEKSYGDSFDYTEFMETPGLIRAALLSLSLLMGFALLAVAPIRWFAKKYLFPSSGEGPNEAEFENGGFKVTNVTATAPEEGKPLRVVKTTVKGRGEPGYLLTSVMVGEIALALLPEDRARLTALGKKGGVLTAMSAVGMELIERLRTTGRFTFERELVETDAKKAE